MREFFEPGPYGFNIPSGCRFGEGEDVFYNPSLLLFLVGLTGFEYPGSENVSILTVS